MSQPGTASPPLTPPGPDPAPRAEPSPPSTAAGSSASGPFESADAAPPHVGFWTLMLGSIGVVYGDIGTSPLYAFREALAPAKVDGIVSHEEVLGTASMILWALFLIVTVKYVVILMRMDNNGEGGILSLMALARKALGGSRVVFMLGLVGASLFYGDAIITPAISVLSAVEGLKLVTPAFDAYVLPITVAIIVVLFLVQSRGTARVAAFFGPVMAVWFAAITLAALPHLVAVPGVIAAINPYHAVIYLLGHGSGAFVALGAVFLAVTGAEALFADLGHFGRKPIQLAWLVFVAPALALNYLGQAALVIERPEAVSDPFFLLVPDWALLPMVVLATAATVIASQAVITGAYSLSRQAVQLGLMPRLEIRHTSEAHSGQIYLPQINTLLLIGVIVLAAVFRSSSALASAYGIAVTGTMLITACLAFLVLWRAWGWSPAAAGLLMAPFVAIETLFLVSNMLKVFEGGYVPLLFAGLLVVLMWTWVRGVSILFAKTRRTDVPLGELVGMLEKSPPHHVKGTAVFLTSDPETAPAALLHNLKHNKVLHEKNVVLTIRTVDLPRLRDEDRVRVDSVGNGFWRVTMKFGYMESPNVPRGLALLRKVGFKFDIMATSFFLSRRSIRPAAHSGMPLWQDRLFIALAKNANDATDFFQIPTGRVVEVGTQVTV